MIRFARVLGFAGLAASCSSSDDGSVSTTPLGLSQSNASAAAAEALTTSSKLGDTSTTGTPSSGAAIAQRAAVRHLAGLPGGALLAPGSPATELCAVGGSTTTTTTGVATAAQTLTFDNCIETPGVTLNGTLKYTGLSFTTSSDGVMLTATVDCDLAVTEGTLSYTEAGGYTLALTLTTPPSVGLTAEVFDLSGKSLSLALTKAGVDIDRVELTDFGIHFELDLQSSSSQMSSSTNYVIASSRLDGQVTVATTVDLMQIVDSSTPHDHPYTGQLLLTGANHTRLQITIAGDETYTPPAGEGQVELELDLGTGSFGTPTWVSWATLDAAASASASGR